MGKSYKKSKFFGNAGGSEKKDKQWCNRSLRHKVKQKLEAEEFDAPMPLPNEVRNIWSMAKDGKHYWPGATKRDMGK